MSAASYTPFFKESWDRKSDTESTFTFSGDETSGATLERQEIFERVSKRPPATLPKPPPRRFETFGKTGNSNRQELFIIGESFTIAAHVTISLKAKIMFPALIVRVEMYKERSKGSCRKI